MNPLLEEIYSTVVPSMPYLIGAYVLVWLALMVFVIIVFLKVKKATAQVALLEEAVAERSEEEQFAHVAAGAPWSESRD